METRFRDWLPGITLLTLALISGISWRTELELSVGWEGLRWLRHFFWAVPICVLAFIVWAACVARVRRTYSLATVLVVFAIVTYVLVEAVFTLYFAAGPSGMLALAFLGAGDIEVGLKRFWILQWVVPLIWALIPLAFCIICRVFGAQITIGSALSSAVFFTLSWPVAIVVRGGIESRGSQDLIHALKSGFVIPFLIVALGFPLLRSSRRRDEIS